MDMVLARSMIGISGLLHRRFLMVLHGRMSWDEVLEVEVSSMACAVSYVTFLSLHFAACSMRSSQEIPEHFSC